MQENTNAFLIHISAFSGYFFPFASIFVPLILWKTQKNSNDFIEHHGKEAVNFNISYGIYQLILGSIFVGSLFHFWDHFYNNLHNFNFNFNFDSDFTPFHFPFGFISVIGIFGIVRFALTIIGALKAQKGEFYKYPLTIKFIK